MYVVQHVSSKVVYLGCKKMEEEVDLNDILRKPFLLVKRLIKKLSMFFVPKPRACSTCR